MNVHINLLNDNALNSVLDNYFTIEASDDTSKRFKKIPIERMKQSTMKLFYSYKQHKPIAFVMTNDDNIIV